MARNSTQERGKEPARNQAHTLSGADAAERFITCIVTPKISFSLPNKGWSHVEEISQSDLRKAFLARFPMEFDVERVVFTPLLSKQPAEQQSLPSRLVFKIGVRGSAGSDSLVDDEHVLLNILQSLDKAYAERHQAQLASAKSELLSSCMSFELMADEIRRAQTSAASELSRLKEQASSSQKRLFMLELEKEQLQAARASSESVSEALRQRVDLLARENRELRGEVGGLTDRLESLTQLVLASTERAPAPAADAVAQQAGAGRGGGAGEGAARAGTAEITTQTGPPAVDRMVGAMAAWLRQGSQILSLAADEAPEALDATGARPAERSSVGALTVGASSAAQRADASGASAAPARDLPAGGERKRAAAAEHPPTAAPAAASQGTPTSSCPSAAPEPKLPKDEAPGACAGRTQKQ